MNDTKVTKFGIPLELVGLGGPFETSMVRVLLDNPEAAVQCSFHVLCSTVRYLALNYLFTGINPVVIKASPDIRKRLLAHFSGLGIEHWIFSEEDNMSTVSVMPGFKIALHKKTKDSEVEAFSNLLHQFIDVRQQLHTKYDLLEKPVFGRRTWKMLADKYAVSKVPEYKKLLAALLNPLAYECTPQEFWFLKGRIESFNQLEKLLTDAFGILGKINLSPYQSLSLDELGKTLQDKLLDLINEGERILIAYADFLEDYKSKMRKRMMGQMRIVVRSLEEINLKFSQFTEEYGEQFLLESSLNTFSNKIKQQFNKSSRELLKARSQVKTQYLDLISILNSEESHVLFQDLELEENLTIEHIFENLKLIEIHLNKWPDRLYGLLDERCKELNSNNISNREDYKVRLQGLEKAFEEYKLALNKSALLPRDIELNALSLQKKSKEILASIQHLKAIENALPELEEYLLWSAFQSHLPSKAKTLIDALTFLSPEKRISTFSCWYFSLALEKSLKTELLESPNDFNLYNQLLEILVPEIIPIAKKILHARRQEVLKELKKSNKFIRQSLSRKNGISTQILATLNKTELLQLFPIILEEKETSVPVPEQKGQSFRTLFINSVQSRLFQISQIASHPDSDFPEVEACNTPLFIADFHWRSLPLSQKLKKISGMAAQFEPFLAHLKIYNTKYVQIFSFLGPILDEWLLQELKYPYKSAENHINPSRQKIEEAFLDIRKPIVLMCRDHKIGDTLQGSIAWHHNVISKFRKVGLILLDTFSPMWNQDPLSEMHRISTEIHNIASQEKNQPKATESLKVVTH